MRLFHVSEDENISIFEPRLPRRDDLDPAVGLVWAVEEAYLPFLLLPRDCPRVAYHAGSRTSQQDKDAYCSSGAAFTLAIEEEWVDRVKNTTLYLYEFDPDGFTLQDEAVGYYAAKTTQIPMAKHRIDDILTELRERNAEIRILDNLWDLADAVRQTTLVWLLARMRFARPRPEK